jgi:cardiolipin synthase (CMP-forming)
VLDPAADRLYIAATLIALAIRGIIPWWLLGLLALRELAVAIALALLRRRGYGSLQVNFAGKSATLCLLYAFPLLLLGAYAGPWALLARIVGWAFAIWGTALYWWSGGLYLAQARQLLRDPPGQEPGNPAAGQALDQPAGQAPGRVPDQAPRHVPHQAPDHIPDQAPDHPPGHAPDQAPDRPAQLDDPVREPEPRRESRQP